MKKQVFYAGLEIRSKDPIDERLYVRGLTIAELSRIFTPTGKYASENSVLFDKVTKKFYQLDSFSSTGDAVNPINWKPVGDESIYFSQYVNTEMYGLGAAVYFTDSFNYTSFYLGLTTTILANESPQTSPSKWLDLRSSSSSSGEAPYYQVLHRLEPLVTSTHTIEISIPAQFSDNGSKFPHIEVYADCKERVSSNIRWEKIGCNVSTAVVAGVMRASISLKGDFSALEFVQGNTSQYNINIIIK